VVQVLATGSSSLVIKVSCEICLHEIFLGRATRFNFLKLADVNVEIYLILAIILCLSGYGLNMAFSLLLMAQQEDSLLQKLVHFGAYFWIIAVILYVMLEPLYSEVKTEEFVIQPRSAFKEAEQKEGLLAAKQAGAWAGRGQRGEKVKAHSSLDSRQKQEERRKFRFSPGSRNRVFFRQVKCF
jgi:hypothetical protein